MLAFKDDWQVVKEHYRAWWKGEYFGRAGLWVTAPRDDAGEESPPEVPTDPIHRWIDLDYITALNNYNHRRTYFGGEAFPIFNPGYAGHVGMATFLGCPIHLNYHTGWRDAILLDEDWSIRDLTIDKTSYWYQFGLELLKRSAAEGVGKCIPSIGAIGGCGDILAALRGTNRLLYDVMDRSDLVHKTERHLMSLWCEIYETFYPILRESSEDGSTCWFPLWAPGKFYATQCDFSYMLSPQVFESLFIPVLQQQLEYLNYAIHHVDGIGAFNHVPALCKLERLQALQILPGAGKPSPLHYIETLQYIQRAGKNLHISINFDEVQPALEMLSAKGLFIATSAPNETAARNLVETVSRISKVR